MRRIISEKITDPDALWLTDMVIGSFEKEQGKGLPLGNVTSQLFANIYLNELDRFAKHVLKTRHYFRYCDDFIIVHHDRNFLETISKRIGTFLHEELLLDLHPNKVEIRKVSQGMDFLGYVVFPHRIALRTATKKRLLRRLKDARKKFRSGRMTGEVFEGTVNSYLGVLSHSRNRKMKRWVWKLRESVMKRN